MQKITLLMFLAIAFLIGCTTSQDSTEESVIDSLIEKIDNGKINELTEEEQVYLTKFFNKAATDKELTPASI